jgi:ATP-dependent Clp protease ATP-binding subunit ClpA
VKGSRRYDELIGRARVLAAAVGAATTNCDHLAAAVIADKGVVGKVLTGVGLDRDAQSKLWREFLPGTINPAECASKLPDLADDAKEITGLAAVAAVSHFSETRVQTDHLLLALLDEASPVADRLKAAGIDNERVLAEMHRLRDDEL